MPVVDAMQDTEMGTSNADISRSTRNIEVSLAQGLFTKRSASNETIKRGGRIFGQIFKICKAIALQIWPIWPKIRPPRFIADSDSTRREDFKSERVFALGPREHGQF